MRQIHTTKIFDFNTLVLLEAYQVMFPQFAASDSGAY